MRMRVKVNVKIFVFTNGICLTNLLSSAVCHCSHEINGNIFVFNGFFVKEGIHILYKHGVKRILI